MKNTVILLISIATFTACTKQNTKQVSTIDSTLQVRVDSILQNKLSELDATVGQVIVMEAQTGEIKASVGSDSILQESGLVRTVSLLAALETKAVKLSDTVDVDNGILTIGKDTLCDHNWYRGGYGKITVEQGFGLASNIANYKIVKKVFENEQAFSETLAKYGYQVKDTSLVYNPLGYGILTTPLQNLTFINNIAKSNTTIKEALAYSVSDGLAKPAQSDKVKVAGATGTIQLPNGEYAVEFCGYFPADNPKYSVIVTINKTELPASGGLMAGDVFRQIVDIMNWKIQCKLPPKTKRFCPLKTFNNAPLKSLDRWGYYYFSLFPSVCSHFTDTFSCQLNPVRRMYNTIHNGICYCRVSDCIIPIVRWQLRGDDDGLAPMSVLYYIEQDGSFLGIKVHKEEVIQYEQRAPFDSLEFRFQCAFYFCHLKRTHKFRSIRIICPYALLAGFIPHCCGKEALPGTG